MKKSFIPVLKPHLPLTARIVPYLERIDSSRWYTNRGQLTVELERKLADHFAVDHENVVLVSNGTDALIVSLLAMDRSQRICLMPSWSFVATALAAVHAGLKPVFVDIDKATWATNPDIIRRAITELNLDDSQIHSVIPVAPFGAPLNVDDWSTFSSNTKIPILVDGAASFDTLKTSSQVGNSQISTMLSLHATKVFGVGEGALIIAANRQLSDTIRKTINFGFWGTRDAQVLGMNAKLSEYASAVGLAELGGWLEKRGRWAAATQMYLDFEQALANKGIKFAPLFGGGWISSYCNILCRDELQKLDIQRVLDAEGIETREWWGNGIHEQLAFQKFQHAKLDETKAISKRIIGLPFYTDLHKDEVQKIISVILECA